MERAKLDAQRVCCGRACRKMHAYAHTYKVRIGSRSHEGEHARARGTLACIAHTVLANRAMPIF